MKTKFLVIAIAAGMLLSCERPSVEDASPVFIEVDVSGRTSVESFTKCVDVSASSETDISDLQVLVFRPDGALDGYSSSSSSQVKVKCSSGERDIYAVANAPSLHSVRNIGGMRSVVSDLADNACGRLVMSGMTSMDVGAGSRVEICVTRLCAKVVLERVRKAFVSTALQSRYFRINRIYMTNVAGDAKLDGDGAPSGWYNRLGFESGAPSVIHDEVWSIVDDTYGHKHTFYVYPNDNVSDVRGGAWSPRRTRLVIDANVGETRCYYVLDMPALERNTAYVIRDLAISRLGSDDEENPCDDGTLEICMEVRKWEEGGSYAENM